MEECTWRAIRLEIWTRVGERHRLVGGSALEPNELQALPAELSIDRRLREAETPRQCVPRQEPGNERVRGGVQREVS